MTYLEVFDWNGARPRFEGRDLFAYFVDEASAVLVVMDNITDRDELEVARFLNPVRWGSVSDVSALSPLEAPIVRCPRCGYSARHGDVVLAKDYCKP